MICKGPQSELEFWVTHDGFITSRGIYETDCRPNTQIGMIGEDQIRHLEILLLIKLLHKNFFIISTTSRKPQVVHSS